MTLLFCGSASLALGQVLDSDRDGLDDFWEIQNFGNLAQGVNGDPDGDGLYNQQEQTFGSDPTRFDSDGDVLSDRRERDLGTNPRRADTDDDTLTDYSEVELHHTDPRRRDSDGGGRGDGEEVLLDHTDPLVAADDALDSDGDGLFNRVELGLGTNPLLLDSDGDSLGDAEEDANLDGRAAHDINENGRFEPELGDETDPALADTDGDGLDDGLEFFFGSDPFSRDSDADGYSDGAEYDRRLAGDACLDPSRPDSDFDGVPDGVELDLGLDPCNPDSDADGVPDLVELDEGSDPSSPDAAPDSDGDGLSDDYERDVTGTDPGAADSDGDGLDDVEELYPLADRRVTDPLDADSDDDGLLDGSEANPGGATNPLAIDSDGDGLSDGQERGLAVPELSPLDPDATDLGIFVPDADPTSVTDPLRRDTDQDSLDDGEEDRNLDGERQPLETDPSRFDTDGDGMGDAWEVAYSVGGGCPAGSVAFLDPTSVDASLDIDGDGLSNIAEYQLRVQLPIRAVPSPTSPCDPDSDDDGLGDGVEASSLYPGGQTDPTDPDRDSDGLPDGLEDRDSDGHRTALLETDPTNSDSDADLLLDDQEDRDRDGAVSPGETDPRRFDSDDDGIGDGLEVLQYGTDPLDPDSDADGIGDGVELGLRPTGARIATITDPRNVDSDGDDRSDGEEDLNRNGHVDDGETDPTDYDTDDGGVSDGLEVARGTDPLDPSDDLRNGGPGPRPENPEPGAAPDAGAGSDPEIPMFPIDPPFDLPDAAADLADERFGLEPNTEIRGSGACNLGLGNRAAPGAGWLALPLALGLLRRRPWRRASRRLGRLGLLGLASGALPQPAQAQSATEQIASAHNTNIDANPHRLDPSGFDLLGTSRPRVLPHLGVRGAAMLHHLAGPAVVADRTSGDTLRSLVGNREEVTLGVAVGVFDQLQVSVMLPAVLHQRAELPGQRLDAASSSGIGNLSVVPRAVLYRARKGSLRAGIEVPVTLPLWETPAYMGYEGWGVEPRVLSEQLAGPILISVSMGALIKRNQRLFNLEDGDQFTYAAAAEYPELLRSWDFGVEFQGGTPLDRPGRATATRGELLGGGRHRIDDHLSVTGGAGAGLFSGIGQPSYRVFVAVGYALVGAVATDAPRDGKPGAPPDCRHLPPGAAPPPGCITADADGDGVADAADQCPGEAEDRDGFEDTDGCPDPDNDADGALDVDDGCPLEPEDRDGFKDGDGCPDPDNDGDGVIDSVDKCPLEPEDFDGTEDADGCPDLAPSAVLGSPGQKSCPDGARPSPAGECYARIDPGLIHLTESIQFATRTEKLMEASRPVLDQVTDILDANPDLHVLIVGHTDGRGTPQQNVYLSQLRATIVRMYVLQQSKDAQKLARRLEAIGKGSSEPIDSNDSAVGRARNRRVEFLIVEKKRPEPRPSPTRSTPPAPTPAAAPTPAPAPKH